MLELESQDRLGVVGVTGSGKTFYTRTQVFAAHRKVVAYDPHGEFITEGYIRCTMAEFARLGKTLDSLQSYRISVVPGEFYSDKEAAQAFRDFYMLCKTFCDETTIIIEECGLWEDNEKGRAVLNLFATQSRHWHCPCVFVAQRLVQIPPIARAQLSILVAFHQHSDEDMKAGRAYFRDKTPELSRLPARAFKTWRQSDDFGRS